MRATVAATNRLSDKQPPVRQTATAQAQSPALGFPSRQKHSGDSRQSFRRLHRRSEPEEERPPASSREASLARAKECDRVFVIEDTTSLNYTGHPATTGLGPITSTGARATKGLQLHTSMLATPTGLALGILDAACWSRDPESFGSKHRRKHRPIAEKESNKWLRGYEAANEAAERLEKTEVVVICDREADMYELFHAAAAGRARVLVRAAHPRSIVTVEGEQEGNLWECLAEERVKKTVAIPIARSGTRPAREAIVDLRCREVRLAAPPRMTKGVAWNRRYVRREFAAHAPRTIEEIVKRVAFAPADRPLECGQILREAPENFQHRLAIVQEHVAPHRRITRRDAREITET